MLFAAEKFAELFENGTATAVDHMIAGNTDRRIGRYTAAGVGPAAFGTDHEISNVERSARGRFERTDRLSDPVLPRLDRASRAAAFLNDQKRYWPTGLFDHIQELRPVHLLATERNQKHRADIGMGAKRFHHVLGIGVGITAGKTDQLRAVFGERRRNGSSNMMRTFHQIGDQHIVADTLSTVLAHIARKGG